MPASDTVASVFSAASILMLDLAMLEMSRQLRRVAAGNDGRPGQLPEHPSKDSSARSETTMQSPGEAAARQSSDIARLFPGSDQPPPRQSHRFIMDSIVLLESFKHVCSSDRSQKDEGFREVFHYATGLHVDEATFVVGHIVPVVFSQQSASGVRVADESNIRALASLDEIGLPLVAHFHSHPGHGSDANHPSATDRKFQERLERGGHIAIGGIFSRDGHLRFFAGDRRSFSVEVQGNHFRKVEDNVYELVADRDFSVGARSA